jgi:hypothetical protein
VAKLFLPGDQSVPEFLTQVRASQPHGYASAVAVSNAYHDGCGVSDTIRELQRTFPNTADAIMPVDVGVLKAISDEKARVYEGDPDLDLIDARTRDEIETAADGVTQWEDVLDEADFWPTLRRSDSRTVVSRLAFVRVLWDAIDERLRLDVFDADKVFPLYNPDRPDIATAPVVMLELAPSYTNGKPMRRFEVWTAVVDESGKVVDASITIVDETGEILREAQPNPYRGPNGLQGTEPNSYPVIPIVAIGDVTGVPWPWPLQQIVDFQRSINVQASNALHCKLTQSHGQWSAAQTEERADSWTGAPKPKDTKSRLLATREPDPTNQNLAFGPAEVLRVPYGWQLTHTAQGAQLAEIRQGLTEDLRNGCTLAGVPSRTLVPSDVQASGVALIVEREPVERYRRERVAAQTRSVERLGTYCRIVWNTHHDSAQRFLSAGGVKTRFVPDHLRPIVDPVQAADLAQKLKATGLYSDAQVLARVDGLTVEDAQAQLEATREERGAAMAARTGAVSRVFASPLAQARGTPAVESPAGNDPEDDEEDA